MAERTHGSRLPTLEVTAQTITAERHFNQHDKNQPYWETRGINVRANRNYQKNRLNGPNIISTGQVLQAFPHQINRTVQDILNNVFVIEAGEVLKVGNLYKMVVPINSQVWPQLFIPHGSDFDGPIVARVQFYAVIVSLLSFLNCVPILDAWRLTFPPEEQQVINNGTRVNTLRSYLEFFFAHPATTINLQTNMQQFTTNPPPPIILANNLNRYIHSSMLERHTRADAMQVMNMRLQPIGIDPQATLDAIGNNPHPGLLAPNANPFQRNLHDAKLLLHRTQLQNIVEKFIREYSLNENRKIRELADKFMNADLIPARENVFQQIIFDRPIRSDVRNFPVAKAHEVVTQVQRLMEQYEGGDDRNIRLTTAIDLASSLDNFPQNNSVFQAAGTAPKSTEFSTKTKGPMEKVVQFNGVDVIDSSCFENNCVYAAIHAAIYSTYDTEMRVYYLQEDHDGKTKYLNVHQAHQYMRHKVTGSYEQNKTMDYQAVADRLFVEITMVYNLNKPNEEVLVFTPKKDKAKIKVKLAYDAEKEHVYRIGTIKEKPKKIRSTSTKAKAWCENCGFNQAIGHLCSPKTQCPTCGIKIVNMEKHKCNYSRITYRAKLHKDVKRGSPSFIAKRREFLETRDKYMDEEALAKHEELYGDNKHLMIIKPLAGPAKISTNQYICFDLETYVGENEMLVPYALGWVYEGHYQHYEGTDCVVRFLNALLDIEIPIINRKVVAIPIMAWNGSAFDFQFIMDIMERIDPETGLSYFGQHLKVGNLLRRGGKLFGFGLSSSLHGSETVFYFRDPCLILTSSLARACKDFNVSAKNKKSQFPHLFIKSIKDIDATMSFADMNNVNYYFPRDLLTQTYVDSRVGNIYELDDLAPYACDYDEHSNEVYSLHAILDDYLKRDVMSMKEIVDQFYTEAGLKFNTDITQFTTISGLTWALWQENFRNGEYKTETIAIGNKEYQQMARDSVIGGCVYRTKRHFEGQHDLRSIMSIENAYAVYDGMQFRNRENISPDDNETLSELDVTSLYPWAMTGDFPVGIPIKLSQTMIEEWNRKLRVDYETGTYQRDGFRVPDGVYEIYFLPNRHLIHPVLPRRDKTGSNWDLEEGYGCYCAIDVNEAIERQYAIVINAGYFFEKSLPIYKSAIERCFKMKSDGKREGNVTMEKSGKLLANSLYGKTMENPMDEQVFMVHSEEDIEKIIKKNGYPTRLIEVHDDLKILQIKQYLVYEKRPVLHGVMVAARGRQRMRYLSEKLNNLPHMDRKLLESFSPEYYKQVIGKAVHDTWYYMDTDSMYVREDQKHLFDFEKSAEMGELKDESVKGGRILHGFFIGKKNYGYIYIKADGTIGIALKTKGMRKEWLSAVNYVAAYQKPDCKFPLNINYDSIVSKGEDPHALSKGGKLYTYGFGIRRRGMTRQFLKTLPNDRVYVNENLEVDIEGNWTLPYGHALVPVEYNKTNYQDYLHRQREEKMDKIYEEECREKQLMNEKFDEMSPEEYWEKFMEEDDPERYQAMQEEIQLQLTYNLIDLVKERGRVSMQEKLKRKREEIDGY